MRACVYVRGSNGALHIMSVLCASKVQMLSECVSACVRVCACVRGGKLLFLCALYFVHYSWTLPSLYCTMTMACVDTLVTTQIHNKHYLRSRTTAAAADAAAFVLGSVRAQLSTNTGVELVRTESSRLLRPLHDSKPAVSRRIGGRALALPLFERRDRDW